MIRNEIKTLLENAVKVLGIKDIPNFSVEVPEQEDHGDYSTNVALLLAKTLGKKPIEVAEGLVGKLQNTNYKIQIAQPGFINFFVQPEILQGGLDKILKKKDEFGLKDKLREKIQVEFISANPTGPLTLANGRGGFFGDTLSRVLEHQGFEIEREYYINDAGDQIRKLGDSVLAAVGEIPDNDDYYHGGYIKEWAEQNKARIKKSPLRALLGAKAAEDFLENYIKPSIKDKMKIEFTKWTSEYKDVCEKGYFDKAWRIFKDQGFVYESEGAQWLKTTDFGDDKDRVLMTSTLCPTYLMVDAGHHLETIERGYGRKINILGADHHGYVSRIKAVAKILGFKQYDVVIMQLVRLVSGGKEVRMSKRKGNFVTIDELIDEVGVDVARFFFLERSPNSHMDFDLELAKKQSQENPVYYVQYAHSRCANILAKSDLEIKNPKLDLLKEKEELRLIKKMVQFPEVVEDTARDFQVQRLPRYALELAKIFHGFYEKHRVITDNKSLSEARLALTMAVKNILKNTFDLLNIASPDNM